MRACVDYILLLFIKALSAAVNGIPLSLRHRIVSGFIRSILFFLPRYRRIADQNLRLAFPHESKEWREQIYQQSIEAFARIFVDFIRMPQLDEQWVRTHVECPYLDEYQKLKMEHPETGFIFATGHLGSFELLAHSVPMFGFPISFVVRSFKLPRVNSWWKEGRERFGNRVIDRKGAFKATMEELAQGRDVGILFDQNVTRNHAVFVDFFGRPAATTKMVGLAALRTKSPVLVNSITFLGNDRYRINTVPLNFSKLYNDESLSTDEKVRLITEAVSSEYEKMIRANPGEWFWMHRRWKTTERDTDENLYKDC